MYDDILKEVQNQRMRDQTEVLAYLKHKYDEDFEIIGRLGQSKGLPADIWTVSPKNISFPQQFTVIGVHNSEKNYQLHDSYFSVLCHADYTKFIDAIIQAELSDYSLTVILNREGANPDLLTRDTSIQNIYKYATHGGYTFTAMIRVNINDTHISETAFNKVCYKIAHAKLMAYVVFTTTNGKQVAYYIDHTYTILTLNQPANIPTNQELTISQYGLLAAIVYLNGWEKFDLSKASVQEVIQGLLCDGFADSMIDGHMPAEISKQEWEILADRVLSDPALCNMRIAGYVNVLCNMPDTLAGHKAICFMDSSNNAYIVFRGTWGDDEWIDNALGMVMENTIQQQAALRFVNTVIYQYPNINKLYVCGHSKGGNKTQYVTILSDKIHKCVSIDGQGFSAEFLHRYKNRLTARNEAVTLIAEQRDCVNGLGLYLYNDKTKYYRGWRGEHTEKYPYGQDLSHFHCPDALWNAKDVSDSSAIAILINKVLRHILTKEEYGKELRYRTVMGIISLTMHTKPSTHQEIADAIVTLIVAFMELVDDTDFQDTIKSILVNEGDVLVASLEFAIAKDQSAVSKNDLASLVFSSLRKKMFANITAFSISAKKLITLLKEIATDVKCNPKALEYILYFANKPYSRFIGKFPFVGNVIMAMNKL